MATAAFSKFAGILSAALSQHRPKRSSKGRGSCSDSTSYHARAEGASGLTPSRLRPSPNPLHLARRPAGQDAETLRLTADRVCSRGGQMRRENTPQVCLPEGKRLGVHCGRAHGETGWSRAWRAWGAWGQVIEKRCGHHRPAQVELSYRPLHLQKWRHGISLVV